MPRVSSLKPTLRKERVKKGLAAWCVNVSPELGKDGKRQQLFFSTKAEASRECEKLKARKDNFGTSLTAMTPARIAKAAEAYKLLDPINVDLLDAVRGFIGIHKQRTTSIQFLNLCNLYIDSRQGRDPDHLKGLRNCRDRFPSLHSRLVSDITHRNLEPLLSPISPGGRNLLMRHLRAFFNFGIKRGYLTENPISRLDFVEVLRKEVETISSKDVEAMLADALANDPDLLPFLTLGFFCGIRPDGELQKLHWSDVDLTDKIVTISPTIAKTKRRRFVDVSSNAVEWLQAFSARVGGAAGSIVKYNESALYDHRKLNRERAGVAHWPNSAMRHTFCSNWLAMYGDINKLVLMSGHTSVDTMWKHYHRGTKKAEAEKFWSIVPPKMDAKIVAFASA
jgi:integrase